MIIKLATDRKISKRILQVDKPPVCLSCLFGKAHKRQWRTKGGNKKIKKEGVKPGEDISIDQVVMSHPGIVL